MFKPFALTLLSIALALTSIRLTSNAVREQRIRDSGLTEEDISGPYERRFSFLLQNLPEIEKGAERKTLYIGTSLWHLFLDPRSLDSAAGGEGFNLSFAGMIGQPYYLLVARLRAEFQSRAVKFDKVFLEFSPASYSRRNYSNTGFHMDFVYGQSFPSAQVWRNLLVSDPIDTARLVFRDLIRIFGPWTLPGMSFLRSGEPETVAKTLAHQAGPLTWEDEVFREKPEWRIEQRGAFNWNLPGSRDAYFAALEKSRGEFDFLVKVYARRHGIRRKFTFHEPSFRMFVKSALEAKQFAEHVYIIIPPYAPSLQALANEHIHYAKMTTELCRATGLPVLDMRDAVPYEDRYFADPMHARRLVINRYMNVAFNRIAAGENNCP